MRFQKKIIKNILIGILILPLLAFATPPTDQDARRLSTAIINRIPAAEIELKKAVEYGDEDGYNRLQIAPMVRLLRAWRDGEENAPALFQKYNSCLLAGTHFQSYGTAMFERTLQGDRDKKRQLESYKEELSRCKQQLR